VTFERFSVVVVPFPFADRATTRRRPAVVVSAPEVLGRQAGHSILAMVTSAANPPWPLDVPVSDLGVAGLPQPSVVRMKLFTLDDRLVLRVAGRLAPADAAAVENALRRVLGEGQGSGETLALLKVLALGNRQIEEGKVQPATDVVGRLRERLDTA
jgi:mRNA interferase MazF